MKKTKKGFTLIELLVVVLIIGILAAIAVPQYQKAVLKSRLANLKLISNSIYKAQEAYFLATGTYTIKAQELDLTLPIPNEIEDYETETGYIYDWGKCSIHSAMISCFDSSFSLKYGQYYSTSSFSRKNKAECCGMNETGNKVCKTDTGKENPFTSFTAGETTYVCYSYE